MTDTLRNALPDWRTQDYNDAGVSLSDPTHPIWQVRRSKPMTVVNMYAATLVRVPDLGDERLEGVIAAQAAITQFERAAGESSDAILEAVAALCDGLGTRDQGGNLTSGGTEGQLADYLDSIGVKGDPHSKSLYSDLLKWLDGGRPDPTGKRAKWAQKLTQWAALTDDQRPVPFDLVEEAGTPNGATSSFAAWARGTKDRLTTFADWLKQEARYRSDAEKKRAAADNSQKKKQYG